jgi:hypothetical protein
MPAMKWLLSEYGCLLAISVIVVVFMLAITFQNSSHFTFKTLNYLTNRHISNGYRNIVIFYLSF